MKIIKFFFLSIFLMMKNFVEAKEQQVSISAKILKIKGSLREFKGDVRISVDGFTLSADIVHTSEDENHFTAQGNVSILFPKGQGMLKSQKCEYIKNEQLFIFDNVEIEYENIVFKTEKKCKYSFNKRIFEYNNGGRFFIDNIEICSDEGTVNIKEKKTIIKKNVKVENENLILSCDEIECDYDSNGKALLKGNEIDIKSKTREKDFLLKTKELIKYNFKDQIMQIEHVNFKIGKLKGKGDSVLFYAQNNKVELINNVVIQFNNTENLLCAEKIEYDFKKKHGCAKNNVTALLGDGSIMKICGELFFLVE